MDYSGDTTLKEEIKLAGKRKMTILSILGFCAFGFAIWRSSWIAFAVGVTCWLTAGFVACLSIALAISDMTVKEIKKPDAEVKE